MRPLPQALPPCTLILAPARCLLQVICLIGVCFPGRTAMLAGQKSWPTIAGDAGVSWGACCIEIPHCMSSTAETIGMSCNARNTGVPDEISIPIVTTSTQTILSSGGSRHLRIACYGLDFGGCTIVWGMKQGIAFLFDVDVLAWKALSRATVGEPRGGDRWPAAPPGSHRQALALDDPLGPELRAWVQADTVKSQCPDGALTMSMISVPLGQMISSSLPSGTMINLPYLAPK